MREEREGERDQLMIQIYGWGIAKAGQKDDVGGSKVQPCRPGREGEAARREEETRSANTIYTQIPHTHTSARKKMNDSSGKIRPMQREETDSGTSAGGGVI